MAKLHWRYGSMGAGKTLALLAIAHNYERVGKTVALWTARIDDRFAEGTVTSRLGIARPARTFTCETVFDRAPEGAAAILLDEAQFLTAVQVGQLHRLAAGGEIPVIAFGIRTDFRGVPFEGAAALGALADEIEQLRTVCGCGRKATMQARLDGQGQRVNVGAQVQIGGDGMYVPHCATCFYAGEQRP